MNAIEARPETIEGRGMRSFERMNGVDFAEVAGQVAVANGILLTIKYKKNGIDTWGWYFENDKINRSLNSTNDVAKFIESVIQPRSLTKLISETSFSDLVKMTMMSFLTIIFALAVIYLVINQPENKSIQIVTGLLGLTLGYFVGKADK